MAQGKRYLVKVSNQDGDLLAVWEDVKFGSFSWVINGGFSELELELPRRITDFGEGFDVALNNHLEMLVSDAETAPEGKRVYSGYISKYIQRITGNQESILVRCMGYQSRLAERILEETSGNTTITYADRDPSYIIKDIIAKAGTRITTTQQSIENTGLSITYTFRANTCLEAIQRIMKVSPKDFFWFIDADNVLHFQKARLETIGHQLIFGKDFNQVEIEKSFEELKNRVFFIGGGSPKMYRKSSRTSSISSVGRKDELLTDQRVTLSTTADRIATEFLNSQDHPQIFTRMKIVDSNIIGPSGYDIELFSPGDLLQINNIRDSQFTKWDTFIWDVDFWDFSLLESLAQPFVIRRVNYLPDGCQLDIGNVRDSFPQKFNDLEGSIENESNQNIPDAPTSV